MKKVLAVIITAALVMGLVSIPAFALDHTDNDTTKVAINLVDFALSFDTFYLDGQSHMEMGWGADGSAHEKLNANPVTGVHQNLTVRGWMGLRNTDITSVGYKLNLGEPVYDESFKVAPEPGLDAHGGETRMMVQVPLAATEDPQLITICALGTDGNVYDAIEFSINGKYEMPVDPGVKSYVQKTIMGENEIGSWLQKANTVKYVEFTTAGEFKSFGLPIYWASNEVVGNGAYAKYTVELFKFVSNPDYTFTQSPLKSVSFDGHGDNDPVVAVELDEPAPAGTYIVRFTLTNPEDFITTEAGEEKTSYLVLPTKKEASALPDTAKFRYNAEGECFNIFVNGENIEEFFVANPADSDTPGDAPETSEPQPQTGDAAVAMIAVIAVLAMGAAVVFARKRSF